LAFAEPQPAIAVASSLQRQNYTNIFIFASILTARKYLYKLNSTYEYLYQLFCAFLCYFFADFSYLCTIVRNHQIKHSYGTIIKIIRTHGARTALFPLHPAALSLAEIEVTSRRRSRSPASNIAQAPHIPPVGSKQNLPISRTPLKRPILGAF